MKQNVFAKHYNEIIELNENFGWDDFAQGVRVEIGEFAKNNARVGDHLGPINALLELYEQGYAYMEEDVDDGLCYDMRQFAVVKLLEIIEIINKESWLEVVNIPYNYTTEQGKKLIFNYLGQPEIEDPKNINMVIPFEKWLERSEVRGAIDFAKSQNAHYILKGVNEESIKLGEVEELATFKDLSVYKEINF